MMKKTIALFISLATLVSLAVPLFIAPSPVQAQAKCGGVDVAFLECDAGYQDRGDPVMDSALWRILEMVLNIMIGLVGIAAVGGLVFAAILYSSAQDNASQVQQAKDMIRNVVIGLVLFLFMWSGLEYLIPGGIF